MGMREHEKMARRLRKIGVDWGTAHKIARLRKKSEITYNELLDLLREVPTVEVRAVLIENKYSEDYGSYDYEKTVICGRGRKCSIYWLDTGEGYFVDTVDRTLFS